MTGLPLSLGDLDHYTLIVADGQAVSDFHTGALGFTLVRIQDVGIEDPAMRTQAMRNYILALPGPPGRTCVVTEGLAEESIFSQYLRKYGPGIHHVAYSVTDLQAAVDTLRAAGVHFTSPEILRDPGPGLRQIFIERQHAGYFIELIERTKDAQGGYFANTNMSRLVQTMASYVAPVTSSVAPAPAPALRILRPAAVVQSFLAQVEQLPRWTCHRSVRACGEQFIEVRMHGDVQVSAQVSGEQVSYRFTAGEQKKEFVFRVTPDGPNACQVEALLPPLLPERLAATQGLLGAELRLLPALLQADKTYPGKPSDEQLILEQSLNVYRRRGL